MLFLQFLKFCAKRVFWAMILFADMLEGQSRALTTDGRLVAKKV